ncbi:gluconate 2-dehydrogenase subunit 3 family protein [soil metagenome]
MTVISRREAMLRVGVLMGGVISAPALSILSGCQTRTTPATEGRIFNADQERIIAEVAELIIPATDTPGAKDAQVPEFISVMIQDCYPEQDQQRFREGVDQLEQNSQQAYNRSFVDLDQEQQVQLLTQAETDARTQWEQNREAGTPFFRLIKELTLIGYFTSEPGATKALAYVQNPGSYNGCTTMEPGQKAWAT